MLSTTDQRALAISLEILENVIYVATVTRDPEQVEECLRLGQQRVQAVRRLLAFTRSEIGFQHR